MTLAALNTFLTTHAIHRPLFVFMTGSSGAGKTFLAKALEKSTVSQFLSMNYFDTIGVPSNDAMIRDYGSSEKWQEAKTHEWIQRMAAQTPKPLVILEGQYNPSFALEACKQAGITNYILINIYADRRVREHRLFHHRPQPELIHDDMANWAQFLKAKTLACGGVSIDTSDDDIERCVEELVGVIMENIK